MRQHQEAKPDIRFLTEMPWLHEHVGQRRRQCRISVVRIAPGQAIGQVVAFAGGVLLHDLAQVNAVAGQGIGQHFVQASALPVRQEQEHREPGDQAAEQGVEQPRQEQPVTITDLIEAEQHHQGNRGGRQCVARGAVDKEHHSGCDREARLDQRIGEQIEQRPGHRQANRGADDPLAQFASSGAVVWLADKQRGEDDPVTLRGVNQVHHAVADAQGQGQAQCMAEQQRGRCQLRAQANPHILEVARRAVEQAAVGGVGQSVGVAGIAEQTVEGAEVGGQCPQRAQQTAPGRVALDAQVFDGGVQVAQRFGEAGVIDERLAHLDRFRQRPAGFALLA